ncbi:LysR family transcriptional regulator [Streptomyces aidingensis]|uniref:DNA-binding transcriptional regulator, LysR family n=1 Tax=Streptomyces aidingensis TaxID=910347 RepID=A0A1I1TTZ5_9ACTN|nr:LysR family transcriptional regulator [Streptomyces aidingensis]SFD62111.1 DNA-binding transcriptional regulator, LysR family [Streptomyces aidingensis]
MDTRLLRTFLTLARTENFTGAAAELHLAQSTVTVQLRALERELGVRLVDRLPRGARLTSAGRRLLAEAEGVLEAEARLRAVAAEAAGEGGQGGAVAGRVVLAAGETLCSARLPGVVAALRRTHPGVELHLYPAGTAAAVEGLRAGRLDLALLLEETADLPGAPAGGAPGAGLAAELIGHEPLALVGAPDHPLAAAGRGRKAGADEAGGAGGAGWAELAAEDFFLHEQGCSYSDRLARELLAVPGARPRLTRFGSIEAARSCVAAGLGLTVLPRVCVAGALRAGTLAEIAGPPLPDVPVQLVRHARRWASPAVRTVTARLIRHFSPTGSPAGHPD